LEEVGETSVFKISTTEQQTLHKHKITKKREEENLKNFASVTLFLPSAGKKTRAREQTTASTTIAR